MHVNCKTVDARISLNTATSWGMMLGWWSRFNDDFNYIFSCCKSRAGSEPELSTSSWLRGLTALTYAREVQLKMFRSDEHPLTRSAIMPSCSTVKLEKGTAKLIFYFFFSQNLLVLPHTESGKIKAKLFSRRITCFFAVLVGVGKGNWYQFPSLCIKKEVVPGGVSLA